MEPNIEKAAKEAPKHKTPLFRALLSVEVWREDDSKREARVVEVELDEAFTYSNLPHAGAALQRGVYLALEEAVEGLLASRPDGKPDV